MREHGQTLEGRDRGERNQLVSDPCKHCKSKKEAGQPYHCTRARRIEGEYNWGWKFVKGDPNLNLKRLFTKHAYSGEDTLDIKLDRPMILNGLRVALGEIEAILNQQPDIRRSHVRVLDSDSPAPRLVLRENDWMQARIRTRQKAR